MEGTYSFNTSGDMIQKNSYSFKHDPVELIIPHKRFPHVKTLKIALQISFAVATVACISLFVIADVRDIEVLRVFGYSTMALSVLLMGIMIEYISVARWGSRTFMLQPEKFSISKTEWNKKPVWKDEDIENILDILDTETLRDDFLQIVKSAQNNHIESRKVKEVCSHMIKVASLDKKVEEEQVNYMLEKYKQQSRFVDEIALHKSNSAHIENQEGTL